MIDKIEDNESIKELKEAIIELKSSNTLINDQKVKDVIEKAEDLAKYPDIYNEIFSNHGWIAHGSLELEVMKTAVNLFKNENLAAAESYLMTVYKSKIENHLHFAIGIEPLYSRQRIIRLSFEDYQNERYHACIPVILMLLDGIGDDLKNQGLYAQGTDLEVWDSLSGHSQGLKKLVSLITRRTQKTNYEAISLPYRNRILHGRELAYDNEIVAVKTFALLFYVSDWIRSLRSEKERKDEYNDRRMTAPTKSEIERFFKKREKREKLFQKWKPREDIYISKPNLDEYDSSTPEGTVLMFFKYIMKGNYGSPTQFYSKQIYGNVSQRERAGSLKKSMESKEVIAVKDIFTADCGPGASDVSLTVIYKVGKDLREKKIELKTVYEVEGREPNRLIKNGIWTIPKIESIGWQLD